jgi:hypothetical protein
MAHILLEDAARITLQTLKIILGPKSFETHVCVVGALAVRQYVPYRETKVDQPKNAPGNM